MKKAIQDTVLFLVLNAVFVVLLVLFAMNRNLTNEMLAIFFPMLIVTSGALLYTGYYDGDMLTAMSAALLLEIGQMTQVLIFGEGGLPLKSKVLLLAAPLVGAIGVWLISWLETKDFGNAAVGQTYLLISTGMLAFVLLVLLVFGKEKNGTKAWIEAGGFSIQPTEFLKPLYVLFHAVLWSSCGNRQKSFLLSAGLTVMVAMLLLVINELGTLLVILLLWIILHFIFSDKPVYSVTALLGTVTTILSGYGVLSLIHSKAVRLSEMGEGINVALFRLNTIYRKLHDRIIIVFDEEQLFSNADYRNGDGYQFYKAREMILKGGLFGSMSSTHVPVEDSDYAFVGLILRCGVVFAIVVLVLFFVIFYRTVMKSVHIDNPFKSVMMTGASLSLILPTFINVMGTTNFSFMTGICIPFLSNGGTSMLLTTFYIMLLLWGTCDRRPDLNGRFVRNHAKPKIQPEDVPFTR